MAQINSRRTNAPIDTVLAPFRSFLHNSVSGGILLVAATVIALVWANSPYADSYHALWHTTIDIRLGDFELSRSLHHWINDGLMAMFFFVVGLEIKREILAGELASFRKSSLPIIAAIGGMVVPAFIFFLFNREGLSSSGWGIPMATDIAFALGILTLLGDRVPLGLKVFLTALAIVDDIGAVLVIAFFYSEGVQAFELVVAGCFLIVLLGANISGVRSPIVYFILGVGGLWLAFLLSGIHPSVAGVLAAFTIPAKRRLDFNEFASKTAPIITRFDEEFEESASGRLSGEFLDAKQLSALFELRSAIDDASTPAQRLEKELHPWVLFVVMPIFALANAGVTLQSGFAQDLLEPVSFGIIFGLFLGKQIGVFGISWIAIRLRLAFLPSGTNFVQLYGAACLAGIGFTMSLFIAGLAFPIGSTISDISKVSIMIASLLSAIVGLSVLHFIGLRRLGKGSEQVAISRQDPHAP